MKRALWIAGIVAFCLFMYFTALPGNFPVGRDSDSGGISGVYTVNGLDANGVEYSGTVVIERVDSSDDYTLQWIITGTILDGQGVVSGDELRVDWRTAPSAADELSGDGVYRILSDGTLEGTRTVNGFDSPATETLFASA